MNELTGALPAHLMERPEVADKTSMGKDDFMKLLMAQLQHQDPLNPMDHKEFGAQLAQFASLEKLTQIGAGIEKLEGGMGEEAKLQALGMIGKRVKAGGAEISLLENKPVDIHLNTEGGFKPSKVTIFGGDGKLVREMDIAPKADMKTITWDGKNSQGDPSPAGKYMMRVAGIGKDGKSQEMQVDLSGKVIGVEMIEKTPMLLIDTANGQTKVEMSKVVNIGEDSKKETTDGKKGKKELSAPALPEASEKVAQNEESSDWPEMWPRGSMMDGSTGFLEYKP
jgi:flagellar basal-body rod modification protein FlgD